MSKMRKRLYIFLLILLILSTDVAFGNGSNRTKLNKQSQSRHVARSTSNKGERPKRALSDGEDQPFWPQRGRKDLDDENPFWATRGRRESLENYVDYEKPHEIICDNCYPPGNHNAVFGNVKHAREDMSPFWGMRGRRDSDEINDDLFWGSRGRRQENDPFWGNRGRRQEDPPFWGHRGRREEDPFWGNRDRRQESPFWGTRGRRESDDPFWGNRGRREETEPFWGNRGRREEFEPFWGNRGRRQESPFWGTRGRRESDDSFWGNRGRREETEPFWGNRGRREEIEPFWGNRGRRTETDPFWSSRGRRKQNLKESILNAINVVEDDIENLSRLRRSNDEQSPPSKLSHLSTSPRQYNNFLKKKAESAEPGTVLDNTMYAEQPGYIVVERNSRSSAEDDPYFISRGKKLYLNFDLEKAARDRRGAIEEIVKSVRNDPYYIARGKKDTVQIGNSTLSREEYLKARELICATIDLIMLKDEKNKSKRNVDSERDRRTILKKLAAQLQMDPYFVSRGKKSDPNVSGKETVEDSLEDFINEVSSKCN